MPELPEVEITCRKLVPLLEGRRFLNFWTDWPRGLRVSSALHVKKDITGKSVEKIERLGKAIMLHLSRGRALAFHQKMSGKVMVLPPRVESRHIHFRFLLSGGKELVLKDPRKFGRVWYGPAAEVLADAYFRSLGLDALTMSLPGFTKALFRRRGMIKPFLLRQDVVAGIGNIVADEALWYAGLHPRRGVHTLSAREVKQLYRSLKKVLRASIRLGGSTMRDWLHPDAKRGGYFAARAVYRRKGEKCARCAGLILRMVVGSRGTFVCISCQPEPS